MFNPCLDNKIANRSSSSKYFSKRSQNNFNRINSLEMRCGAGERKDPSGD